MKWITANPAFPYRIRKPGSAVEAYSCAKDFFNSGSVPTKPETVPGYVWLEDYEIGRRCYLYEEVIPMKYYDTVLSLIWMRQDDNLKDEGRLDSTHFDPDHFTPDGKRYRW